MARNVLPALQWVEQPPREELIEALCEDIISVETGGTVWIYAGELSPSIYNHPHVVDALRRANGRAASLRISGGAFLLTDDEGHNELLDLYSDGVVELLFRRTRGTGDRHFRVVQRVRAPSARSHWRFHEEYWHRPLAPDADRKMLATSTWTGSEYTRWAEYASDTFDRRWGVLSRLRQGPATREPLCVTPRELEALMTVADRHSREFGTLSREDALSLPGAKAALGEGAWGALWDSLLHTQSKTASRHRLAAYVQQTDGFFAALGASTDEWSSAIADALATIAKRSTHAKRGTLHRLGTWIRDTHAFDLKSYDSLLGAVVAGALDADPGTNAVSISHFSLQHPNPDEEAESHSMPDPAGGTQGLPSGWRWDNLGFSAEEQTVLRSVYEKYAKDTGEDLGLDRWIAVPDTGDAIVARRGEEFSAFCGRVREAIGRDVKLTFYLIDSGQDPALTQEGPVTAWARP